MCSVSGRQTSGLQGESSSPPLTVWIRHFLRIPPDPFPPSLGAVNPKQTVEWVGWEVEGAEVGGCGGWMDGWMTNGVLGLEAG